jgi:hypothetical protein
MDNLKQHYLKDFYHYFSHLYNLAYLSTYSPEWNAIEIVFGTVKQKLKKLKNDNWIELFKNVQDILNNLDQSYYRKTHECVLKEMRHYIWDNINIS